MTKVKKKFVNYVGIISHYVFKTIQTINIHKNDILTQDISIF